MTTMQWVGVIIIAALTVTLFLPSKKKSGKPKGKQKRKKNKKQPKPIRQSSNNSKPAGKKKNPVEKFISSLTSDQGETVQDLLSYEHIYENGMTKLKKGTYTAVLEIKQINNRLNSIEEKTSVWENYRDFINAVNIRQTQLVQSHYLDPSDFIHWYEDASNSLKNLTPQLIEAREDVLENYHSYAERKTREYRSYVIFRFNPYKEGGEKGLTTGNGFIDSMIKGVREQAHQITADEAEDLAKAILDEMCDLAYQMLSNLGVDSVRLNRAGVLNMVYMTLNRDLSVVQRLQDASNAGSFSEFKQSMTPFVAEELIKQEENTAKPVAAADPPMDTEESVKEKEPLFEPQSILGDSITDEKETVSFRLQDTEEKEEDIESVLTESSVTNEDEITISLIDEEPEKNDFFNLKEDTEIESEQEIRSSDETFSLTGEPISDDDGNQEPNEEIIFSLQHS